MGVAERRERERAALRARIIDAACDLLAARGLGALSIRAIADRIEYSPAAIYLYFKDKDELVRAVVERMVGTLSRYMRDALNSLPESATAPQMHRALAHAYVRFALENTSFFRVMFEMPGNPAGAGEARESEGVSLAEERPFALGVAVLKRAVAERYYDIPAGAENGAFIGWGLVHGIITLYLSGHLGEGFAGHEQLTRLVETGLDALYEGWKWRG